MFLGRNRNADQLPAEPKGGMMGKIASIIKNVINYGIYPNELKFTKGKITDDQCQQAIKKYIEQAEKEIIELIEKCIPLMDCNDCHKNNESYFVACAMCEWIHDEFKQNLAKLKE